MFNPLRSFFVIPLHIATAVLVMGLSVPAHSACVDMGFFKGDKYIHDFSEDVAVVKETDNRYTFMTRFGRPLNNQWYEEASGFSDGLARVCYNGQYFFIDHNGEEAFPGERYENAWSFQDGYTRVVRNHEAFCINTKGETIAAPQWARESK